MTKEKKHELRQLLEEAKASWAIHDEYNGKQLDLPIDVYCRYLQESWRYFGLARFSPFWIRATIGIVCPTARSRLLEYIRAQFAPFVNDNSISIANYFIERNSNDTPYLHRFRNKPVHLRFILKRLLDIALVRDIEQAVSVFDKCSRAEGAQGVFKHVSVLKGISLKTDIEVSKGIRLVPLLDSGASKEFISHFSFPVFAFGYEFPNFFRQTLLVIDRPGFSIFHKPGPNQEFPQGLPLADLPFQLEGNDAIFRDLRSIDSFQERFSQAQSLILNFPIQIPHGEFCFEEDRTSNLQDRATAIHSPRGAYFFEEDQTFNPSDVTIHSLIPANGFRDSHRANEDHIKKADCLYKRWDSLVSSDKQKLQIAIDRWVKSKASGGNVDKIIDLGIALEALYVTRRDRIEQQLRHRASWHLGKDATHREEIETVLEAIYKYRCDVVHNRTPGKEVEVGQRSVPVTDLVKNAQCICRKSILSIVDQGKFPDWSTLRQRAKQKR